MKKQLTKKKATSQSCKSCPKGITGLVIAGCILFGMGIGFLTGQVPGGLFIGLGIGFFVAAFLRYKCSC